MVNEKELKDKITSNLVYFRKKSGLTQLEAANKISYSDKAVSKWERGIGVPDIFVLAQLADVYGVKLYDIIESNIDNKEVSEVDKDQEKNAILIKKHRLISLISIGLVWVVAAILYSLFVIILKRVGLFYLIFIYAVPVSFIVALVFNCIWGKIVYNTIYESALSWTLCFAVILTYFKAVDFDNPYVWFLLLVPLALQVVVNLFNNLLNTGRLQINLRKDIKKENKNEKTN